ncbi:MAG: MarR family winged helix-turn-helix transcriptional regulator [Streptosporangiaceae bacterium]
MSTDPPPEPGAARPGSAPTRQELINEAGMAARLQQNDYDRFEDAVAEFFGVNRTAMRCMEVLDRVGQLTAGDIARETGLTSGAVTAMLDRLERVGYVRRLRDASDRRRVLVELTDKARQMAEEIYGPLTEAMEHFERYSDDELRLIRDFLREGGALLVAHAARVEKRRLSRDGGAPG